MATAYSGEYYSAQQLGSVRSAATIVPHLLSLFPDTASVLDIGCGVGGWLQEFKKHGVKRVFGLDGDYVKPEMLKILPREFLPADLANVPDLSERFDVCISLEVAEHIPESQSDQFVAALARSAPVVIFSAAVPGQRGTEHINEQWQSYWAKKFAVHGLVAIDCIRPFVFGNHGVEWWYRQNTVLYCAPDRCPLGYSPASTDYELNRVDPEMFESRESGKEALKMLKRSIDRRLEPR